MSTTNFELLFTEIADKQLDELEKSRSHKSQYKAVLKTLGLMESNLRHPSLRTHKYSDLFRQGEEVVFESYAQNHTPGAYRVFWHYGPNKQQITVIAIIPHP